MEKWEYLEMTLVFSQWGRHPLYGIIVEGKRRHPPPNVETRSQFLEYSAKQGWTLIKSYSDVYTFKRAVRKQGGDS